jgi:hypothetical protein
MFAHNGTHSKESLGQLQIIHDSALHRPLYLINLGKEIDEFTGSYRVQLCVCSRHQDP